MRKSQIFIPEGLQKLAGGRGSRLAGDEHPRLGFLTHPHPGGRARSAGNTSERNRRVRARALGGVGPWLALAVSHEGPIGWLLWYGTRGVEASD
jgi:hypothetical protein